MLLLGVIQRRRPTESAPLYAECTLPATAGGMLTNLSVDNHRPPIRTRKGGEPSEQLEDTSEVHPLSEDGL